MILREIEVIRQDDDQPVFRSEPSQRFVDHNVKLWFFSENIRIGFFYSGRSQVTPERIHCFISSYGPHPGEGLAVSFEIPGAQPNSEQLPKV